MTWLLHQNVVFLALIAGLFTWGCTIVGSAIVFFFKNISRKLLDIMMGFAAGVMIAASFWSLLDPSLTYATQNGYGKWSWFPAAAGFLLGGVALRLIDAVVPHLGMTSLKQKVFNLVRKSCPRQPCSFWLSPFIIFQRD